jgi:hypothetical protein
VQRQAASDSPTKTGPRHVQYRGHVPQVIFDSTNSRLYDVDGLMVGDFSFGQRVGPTVAAVDDSVVVAIQMVGEASVVLEPPQLRVGKYESIRAARPHIF